MKKTSSWKIILEKEENTNQTETHENIPKSKINSKKYIKIIGIIVLTIVLFVVGGSMYADYTNKQACLSALDNPSTFDKKMELAGIHSTPGECIGLENDQDVKAKENQILNPN